MIQRADELAIYELFVGWLAARPAGPFSLLSGRDQIGGRRRVEEI